LIRIPKTVFVNLDTLRFGVYDSVLCFSDGVAKRLVLNILCERSGLNTVNTLKQINMERNLEAEIAALSFTREARRNKRHRKEEKKIKRVQIIQIMVQGSIKCESVSLFTIIFSEVKPLN
jgi:hypothetical protein